MPTLRLTRYSACFAPLFLLTNCGDSQDPTTVDGSIGGTSSVGGGGGMDATMSGGSTATGAVPSSTGGVGVGGSMSLGGNGGGATSRGGGIATGGTSRGGNGTGGASPGGGPSTGGISPQGGHPSTGGALPGGGTSRGGGPSTGGNTPTGGLLSGGGPSTGGTSPGGGTSSGGTLPAGGTAAGGDAPAGGTSPSGGTATGGTDPDGGAAPTGGSGVDQNGVGLAKPGETKSNSNDYLNLGDFRVLANKWGSDELGCGDTSLSVQVGADSSVGWTISRNVCGGKSTPKDTSHPDYPEIEFGVHPFGAGSDLATSPDFSSTNMLPIQIKDIQSAVLTIDSLNISLGSANAWNLNFEMWLSQGNPLEPNPGVYAELMAWWGWKNDWACGEPSGTLDPPIPYNQNVTSSGKNYGLCHQSDTWADGKWRYFQFRADSSQTSYNGAFDIKPFLDYLVNTRNYSPDLWITRFEIGTEIDDQTSATVTVKNLTYTINGTSRSFTFGQ